MGFLTKTALLIGCVFVIAFLKDPVVNVLAQIFAGVFGTMVFQAVVDNRHYLKFLPRLAAIMVQGGKLRISFAALIRIKLGSTYLLVKSDRTGKWQPVGGVYRFFDKGKISDLKLKSDIGFSNVDPDEFRLTLSSEHIFNSLKLVDWFESRLGREISPHREYQEELVDTGILTDLRLKSPALEFTHRERFLSYSKHFRVWELKIFEIFELKLSTEQEALLRAAVNGSSDRLVLLDQKAIESSGFVNDTTNYYLGDHTRYVL